MGTKWVNRVLGVIALLVIGLSFVDSTYAASRGSRRHRDRHFQPSPPSSTHQPSSRINSSPSQSSFSSQTDHSNSIQNLNLLYIVKTLGVENPGEYLLNLGIEERLDRLVNTVPNFDPNEFLKKMIFDSSAPTLGRVFRTLGRTQYNNSMILAQPGTGKSFLLDQVVALLGYGQYPDFLRPHIGQSESGNEFEIVRQAYLGNVDVISVDMSLLTRQALGRGQAAPSEPIRVQSVLRGLIDSAKSEFNRSGRRTLFVLDEVALLPEYVHQALKKIMDQTGFRNPNDPILSTRDAGFSFLAFTTQDEARRMEAGDNAIARRWMKHIMPELSIEDTFRVVRNQADIEWSPLYGKSISNSAIQFLIEMRQFLDSPPLSMPGNVLKAVNDLFIWGAQDTRSAQIELQDSQRFLMENAHLTEIWFRGPNGEPPFWNLEERLRERVVGHEEVIRRISRRLKSWGRLGFGGEVPVFFLGGPTGSGKDTIVNALNEILFGHNGSHLMFSLGGAKGFSIESIIEGPPRGNHSDDAPPLLVQAMESGSGDGIVTFNEGKDAPTEELEKLKVFIESGVIRPKGVDSRSRPLRFPIFILGQWGEEIFDGLTDENVEQATNLLSQREIEAAFINGKSETTGRVSEALLNRAKATGGVFLLSRVPQSSYVRIAEIQARGMIRRLAARHNIQITIDPSIYSFAAQTAIESGDGARALRATMVDFTETALSEANDLGLPLRDIEVTVVHERNAQGEDMIVVQAEGERYPISATALRRIKLSCEQLLVNQ